MSTVTCADPTSESVKKLCREYVHNLGEKWRNLHFLDGGKARLAHISGFVLGIDACGQHELATSLADDIVMWLDRLNEYGGDEDMQLSDGVITGVPRYRIVLGDDGTFGGFTLAWYAAVHPSKWEALRDSQPPMGDHEHYKEFRQRIAQAGKIRTELEVWKCYWPDWVTDREKGRMDSVYVQYAYSFNGGLLFHGFGYKSDTIKLNPKGGYWSTHT